VFPHLETIEGRISGEQILCGRGLVNMYRAVARADGVEPRFTLPAEITGAALANSDAVAEEALRLFVTCLGRTAGDLALVFKSRGGVFLTGGIAQKIVPALRAPNFRAAFEDKAPHSALMRSMPVYVITHPLAALAGLAAYARQPDAFGIETRGRRWSSQ
jgi:glucokinase